MEFPTHVLAQAIKGLTEHVDEKMKNTVGPELTDIIKAHAACGAAAGLIPVPFVDMAAVAANTWTMYVRINRAIGMPFSENLMKSIATGLGTNILVIIPGLALAEAASIAAKFVPGLGTAGGMAAGAAADYAIVLVMGTMYVKALTILLANKKPLTEEALRQATKQAGKDKEFVKKAFNEAKTEFKKAKET